MEISRDASGEGTTLRLSSAEITPAQRPSPIPKKTDNLECDLKILMGSDIALVPPREFLQDFTRSNVQLLLNKIFSLPKNQVEEGLVAVLPTKPTYLLPRLQPLPKVKAKTRWEKFADEKGIVKKKRGRKVYDETTKDWAPRWGAHSVKHNLKSALPIIELGPGDDPMSADPFRDVSNASHAAKAKQKLREIRNKMEAAGEKLPTGVANLGPDVNKRHKQPKAIRETLNRARKATGSAGRYDRAAPSDEMATKKDLRKKERKSQPTSLGEEKKRSKKIAELLFKTGSANFNKAAEEKATTTRPLVQSKGKKGKRSR